MSRIELDTPDGKLVVTWADTVPVLDSLEVEPVAALPSVNPEPYVELDGKPVPRERALELVKSMMPRAGTLIEQAADEELGGG